MKRNVVDSSGYLGTITFFQMIPWDDFDFLQQGRICFLVLLYDFLELIEGFCIKVSIHSQLYEYMSVL